MGQSFSAFNKFGLPGISTATTAQVYERHFKNKKTGTFEDFHIAYVEFCKYFNTVMPGKDFDTPPLEKIKEFYKTWEPLNEKDRREKFFEFMAENVHEAPVRHSFLIMAGLAVPAATVIGKRSSKNIPYVKNLKLEYIPNVVFVPLVTLIGIMGVAEWSRSAAASKADESAAAAQKVEEKAAAEQSKKGEAKAP